MITCSKSDGKTVYMNDFVKKPFQINRVKKPLDIDNVSGPYKQYLQVPNCSHLASQPSEDPNSYIKKFQKTNPELHEKYFKTPPPYDLICDSYEADIQTMYQVDYCHGKKQERREFADPNTPLVNLPSDWEYPNTMYTFAYRNPHNFVKCRRTLSTKSSPLTCLAISDEMKKILKLETGKTTYQKEIGDPGLFIIERQMHGEIKLDK